MIPFISIPTNGEKNKKCQKILQTAESTGFSQSSLFNSYMTTAITLKKKKKKKDLYTYTEFLIYKTSCSVHNKHLEHIHVVEHLQVACEFS